MAIQYKDIKPWGRSFDEYIKMFNLSEADLSKRIIGCGDGPASFNAKMKKMGRKVISVDPIYVFSRKDIENKIEEAKEEIVKQTMRNKNKFVWTQIKSIEHLLTLRMKTMKEFLLDYERGKTEGRYLAEELPKLSFKNNTFDIALCSHLLFLYEENLPLESHIAYVTEMLRIANDVRIFPIVNLNGLESMYIKKIENHFKGKGYKVEEKDVKYRFQKGAYKMLNITGG